MVSGTFVRRRVALFGPDRLIERRIPGPGPQDPNIEVKPVQLGLDDRVVDLLVDWPSARINRRQSRLELTESRGTLRDRSDVDTLLEVDGGVNAETIGGCAEAGAELLVAGVAVFHTDDYAATLGQLQSKARARSAASHA